MKVIDVHFWKRMWDGFVHQLEYGKFLIVLLVLVSAWHYTSVLQNYDAPIVAAAIGLLVDLGIFRAVMIAVRYSGSRKQQIVTRWGVAVSLTTISLMYHVSFYGFEVDPRVRAWALAIPLPLLIIALAYFEHHDRRSAISGRTASHNAQDADASSVSSERNASQSEGDAMDDARIRTHGGRTASHMQTQPEYVCEVCGASFASPQSYAAHVRWKCNGHASDMQEEVA